MKYRDLPKEIRELAELRAKEQNYHPNDDTNLKFDANTFAFDFTKELFKFWSEINSGNFSVYYEKYPNHEWRQTEWQPTKGEMVEVSNDEDEWYKEEFLGIAEKSDWKYIVYTSNEYDGIDNYMYCRKLQHEFTIDEARAIISKSKGIELEKIIIK